MLLYWVWFSQLDKLNTVQKHQLLERFQDPEELYHNSSKLDGIPEPIKETLEDKDLTGAKTLIRECAGKGIGILAYGDETYPARLRNTADAPLLLYYKGVLPDWNRQPVIGIVGTRKSTSYGNEMAVRFGRQISHCGALVISGGADGIDTAAMQGALEAGKPTVAVLGCGVDVVYPRKNKDLFAKVMEMGCLISEYPPGTSALAWHFPARNRIISGISNGILVVEAPEKSGALITANHALEQGREVYAVPGNIDVPNCAGSNALLQEGAVPVFSGWDVVKEYAHRWPSSVEKKPDVRVAQSIEPVSSYLTVDKKSIDKQATSPYSVLNSKDLSDTEKKILAALERTPQPLDEVIGKLDISAGTVKMTLTKLSIKGTVVMHPGGRVSLK